MTETDSTTWLNILLLKELRVLETQIKYIYTRACVGSGGGNPWVGLCRRPAAALDTVQTRHAAKPAIGSFVLIAPLRLDRLIRCLE
jgi:hypothetical protein